MKEQEVLTISDLSFGYEKSRDILSGVNLSLKEGEILGILGDSGIGKSSLLRIISGLEVPKKGEILFEGRLLNQNNLIIPPNKRGVGLVVQPFSSLDMNLRAELRLETRQLLKRTNTACIIVSHDLDDVSSFCDKAARLENAQLKEIST